MGTGTPTLFLNPWQRDRAEETRPECKEAGLENSMLVPRSSKLELEPTIGVLVPESPVLGNGFTKVGLKSIEVGRGS